MYVLRKALGDRWIGLGLYEYDLTTLLLGGEGIHDML